jgi:hypothetical protein
VAPTDDLHDDIPAGLNAQTSGCGGTSPPPRLTPAGHRAEAMDTGVGFRIVIRIVLIFVQWDAVAGANKFMHSFVAVSVFRISAVRAARA